MKKQQSLKGRDKFSRMPGEMLLLMQMCILLREAQDQKITKKTTTKFAAVHQSSSTTS
jgi:hypothetical protein